MAERKPARASKGSAFAATKVKGTKRNTDTTLGWAERAYPQLAAWRILAVEWLGLYAGIPEISVSPAPVPPRAHPGR